MSKVTSTPSAPKLPRAEEARPAEPRPPANPRRAAEPPRGFVTHDDYTPPAGRHARPGRAPRTDSSQNVNLPAQVLTVHGNLKVPVRGASPAELETLRATLERLPAGHVRLIPQIVLGDTAGHGGVSRGGNTVLGAHRGPPRVELTHRTLQGVAVSGALMHEVAHVAQTAFGLSRSVRPDDLGTITYDGVNDGHSQDPRGPVRERFANAYAGYFANPDALRRNHPDAFATVERALAGAKQRFDLVKAGPV